MTHPIFVSRRAPLALALCLALAPCLAQAQDDLLARAAALQQAGDAAGAHALLQPQVARHAGEPAFDFALAIAALDSGKPGEAVIALQRVLAVQPDNAQARAELARAYALAGDIDTAKSQFETVVRDPGLPDPVRQRFRNLIGRYEAEVSGGGSDVSGFVQLEAGHDSNINSATDLTSITIPLFAFLGPGTLGGSTRAMDDAFAELQAGVSGVNALDRQNRVFGSVLANWRDNRDGNQFDQASATGTAGYARTLASRDVLSLSAQLQRYWLGHDGYRSGYGAMAQYTHLLPQARSLSFGAQVYRFDYDNEPLRDAWRYALGASYATRVWVAGVNGGHEQTRDAAGDANSNAFLAATFGLQQPLGERLALVASGGIDLRRHDAQDALFLRKRNDRRLDASAGLKWSWRPDLVLLAKVGWNHNRSNIDLYDYNRWTASIGVRYEF